MAKMLVWMMFVLALVCLAIIAFGSPQAVGVASYALFGVGFISAVGGWFYFIVKI